MPTLSCEISQSLMNALETRVRTTGEPLNHIVMRALADHLEVPHATLFQVSTSGALVKGISQGVVTVGELKRHGTSASAPLPISTVRWSSSMGISGEFLELVQSVRRLTQISRHSPS